MTLLRQTACCASRKSGGVSDLRREALNDGIGESLPQRFDAAFNYIQHGIDGLGNSDDVTTAAQRTNYFRETYAYGTDIQAPGVEPFFTHPDLCEWRARLR